MTSNGGMMVSTDKVSEAMPMSFISLRWCSSSRMTHKSVNGLSISDEPRGRRTRIASPDHSCDSRNRSTATASCPDDRGSRTQTMLRDVSDPTSTPADPSVNSSTTGETVPDPAASVSRMSWAHAIRLALAIRPWSRSHFTKAAGDGTLSPLSMWKSPRSSSNP